MTPIRPVSDEHRHEPADYELEPNELAAEAIRRVWQEYDLPVGPTMFRKMADAALTALTQAPRSCWQPIETAPKTGKDLRAKPFLGWCLDDTAPGWGDIRVCWWEPHMDGGRWHGDRDLPEHPTHWQPLPEPPATAIRSNSHDG